MAAENTFRKPQEEKEKKSGPSLNFKKLNLSFLKDKRVHFLFGGILLVLSLYCLVAFTSYLFSGSYDQSVVENIDKVGLKASGQESENVLGLFGAWISHVFIYKYFGLAAYLFVPIFFLIGYKIVFKRELLDLKSNLRTLSFGVLWFSTLLGYLFTSLELNPKYSFIGGGIGYDLSIWLESLLGWGTGVFIIFILIVFLVFNFNIILKDKEADEEYEEEEYYEEDEDIEYEEALEEQEDSNEEFTESDEDRFEVSIEEQEGEDTNELEPDEEEEETNLQEEPAHTAELEVSEPSPKEDKSEEEGNDLEVIIADPEEEKEEEEEEGPIVDDKLYDPTLDLSNYQFPTIDLLNDYGGEQKVSVTKEELEANKDKIVNTLRNYKIEISSIKATIGPTVTLYEIVPEAGIRISKIKNLEDDIALSLAALGIRIIAPIPGKGTIGIEVPNKKPEMVSMHSVLQSDKFTNNHMDLPIALGKTISNEVFVTDLAKMPHLLMAGATGQGKSVGLNAILTSLLYKKHPSQLKFVMVDPKKVELSLYSKIEKHFLAKLPDSEEPIITDTSKVVNTLNSLCIEMDNRYELLKDAGCRNLKEYNNKFVQRKLNPVNGHRFMPYIVLVIDELADLMMTAGKEVETPIARLAQLARAIGIHLIVATQRPSVNVITGIIKANFPARLSFRVTSKIDSRTILDTGGADQLIGKGDMLLSIGSELTRMQCAFVDTPECDDVCEFIASQQGYPDAYILPEYVGEDSNGSNGDFELDDRDAMFEDAAYLIVRNQQGSTSLIQRKMKLGYNRAGRIMDQLEAAGVVGPSQGSKAREVLIPDEYSLEQLLNNLDSEE